jgi:hypothetical protein
VYIRASDHDLDHGHHYSRCGVDVDFSFDHSIDVRRRSSSPLVRIVVVIVIAMLLAAACAVFSRIS